MGCCISSAQNSHNLQPNSHHFSTSDTTHLTMIEEEVVLKEVVLSETPKIPKPTTPDLPPLMDAPLPSSPESSIDPKGSQKEEEIDEIELSLSGVSDFFSFSAIDEVISTSTATTRREKREEEEEEEVVGPPVYARRKKSFSGHFAGRRVGKTRSPEKKSSLVAPARGNVESPQIRRVRAEPARRRPNLPATRSVGDGEKLTVGKSVTMKTGAPRCRSMDATAVERRVVEEPCDAVSGAVLESLENPLVSLECFIFL